MTSITAAVKTIAALFIMAAIAAGLFMAADYGAPARLCFAYLVLGEAAVVAFVAAFLREDHEGRE